MKSCPRCNAHHTQTGTFCSRSCANSRIFSVEAKNKKRIANQRYYSTLSEEEKQRRIKYLSQIAPYRTNAFYDYIVQAEWNSLSKFARRIRVILEQDGCCARCGLSDWQGQKIVFELDHIDGNGHRSDSPNNNRNNLQALCPNCHSLTKNWRGRKLKGHSKSSRQERIQTYLEINETPPLPPSK